MNRRHYVHFYNEKGCSFSASFRQITDEWFMQQLVQYSWFYGCGGLPNITTMFSEYCSDGGEHCLSMHPQARSVASGRGGGWKPYCFLQQFFFLKTYRKWFFGSVYIFFLALNQSNLAPSMHLWVKGFQLCSNEAQKSPWQVFLFCCLYHDPRDQVGVSMVVQNSS